MRYRCWAALALGLMLLAPGSRAAEIAGPALDAARIRAARVAAPGQQLALVFDDHRGTGAPVPLTVLLAKDYLDIVEGGREALYDFRLHRRLTLDRGARVFANFSLFGDVAFRRFELGKRLSLIGMTGEALAGDTLPLSLQPFWIESDVGLLGAAKKEPAIAQQKLPDGATSFRLGGEEVALFAPASEAVPAELRRSFERFLRLFLPLHPDIAAAIALDGRLPQRLVYVSDAGGRRHPAGLVLRRALHREADYPLPSGFEPRPLGGQAQDQEALALRGLLPLMLEAVAGKAGSGPRPLAGYRRAADQALKQNHAFAAAMLLAEAALQYGTDAGDCTIGPGGVPCHGGEELGLRFAADPRAVKLYRAQTDEPRDPKEAVALWESIKHDDVANGYVIDAFLAGRLSAAGHRQAAMGAFRRALEGDPYLAGVYKELGDHFLRASRTDLAWICYDFGRSLPDRDPHDPLASVDELERQLLADYPQFF